MCSTPSQQRDSSAVRNGLLHFFLILIALAMVSVTLAFLPVNRSLIPFAMVVISVLYIGLPVLAIFRAASHPWNSKLAVAFIVIGIIAQVGLFNAAYLVESPVALNILKCFSQSGLMIWCVGLGALLATLLKEKNLLIPVSLFLAAFDIFTVLTPVGPTRVILQAYPKVFESVAWQVPKVQEHPAIGPVGALAYIGPADFLFMAMFFVAIYRFGLRARETWMWLVPSLVIYMLIVGLVGPLPALVPIGLCVLMVNRNEFKLSGEEWASTTLVVALGLGLIWWGATRPKPPPELLPMPSAQETATPANSPQPAQ